MLALLLALQAAPAPAPSEIVAAARPAEWTAIAADDLLVMDLSPDAAGKARRVVIQLMPAPFSQGWVGNIRTLARARWWDGLSVNRVQDNYVVQWGDASEKKALPAGLRPMSARDYTMSQFTAAQVEQGVVGPEGSLDDPYAKLAFFRDGWPLASDWREVWPVHCYGAVGVGRGLSPDAGNGAELYTVIGHAPRHLDRNIAVVGRVIEGIEHLSTLPRGTQALGFYATASERVGIRAIRLASDMAAAERPRFQYLRTGKGRFRALRRNEQVAAPQGDDSSFAAYATARANRRDAFFIRPAGGADVCNIPVPVRREP